MDNNQLINEEKINPLEKKPQSEIINSPKNMMDNLKNEVLKQNWLLGLVEKFEKSPLFENKVLDKWDYLFKEWDVDNNLYIIKKWNLWVEKYTTVKKDTVKQLAVLKSWDFLWEWAFWKIQSPKEASIRALEKSEILKIDAKDELKRYLEENPMIWYELMRHIITETNRRLLESNKLIASNYEIEKTINTLTKVDLKSIFALIDKVKDILDVDYIIFLQKHLVLQNFLQLKYDSRFPSKMQDKVFEKTWAFLDLDQLYLECNIATDDSVIVNKISIWDEIYWYLLIWRQKRIFDWSDKKIFSSMTNSLAWVVKKFMTDKEDKDKIYISEMKKY